MRKLQEKSLFILAPLFFLFTTACGPDPDNEPVVVEGKPFPACTNTGKIYTPQQLIDLAVQNLITRGMSFCSEKYISLENFYARNPDCCDIDVQHKNLREPIKTRHLSGIGHLIGGITMYHYCGTSQRSVGNYRIGFANITSCGIITESTAFPASQRVVGRHPKSSGSVDK